jgi:hypothetical protein
VSHTEQVRAIRAQQAVRRAKEHIDEAMGYLEAASVLAQEASSELHQVIYDLDRAKSRAEDAVARLH